LSRGVGAAQEQLRSESLRKDALTSGAVAVLSVAILLSAPARSSLLAWGGR